MSELLQAPLQLYDQVSQSLGEQCVFRLNLHVGTHFTIDQLLQHDNLIETLSQGCSIKFDAEIPSGLMKKGRELLENAYLAQQEEPPLLLLLLLRSLKLRLKLRSPAQIEKFFEKLGIKELLTECPTLGDLLDQLAMFPEVAELKLHVESPLHFLYRFLKLCNAHVRSEVAASPLSANSTCSAETPSWRSTRTVPTPARSTRPSSTNSDIYSQSN
jgi:hypothetical protein